MDSSEVEEFTEVLSKPIRSLPYDTPGQTFMAFKKLEGVPAVGKFSNMLKFIVKGGISTPITHGDTWRLSPFLGALKNIIVASKIKSNIYYLVTSYWFYFLSM